MTLSPEVVARLIEEQIWCANDDADTLSKANSAHLQSEDYRWLHEKVFPTLVPALARILELANEDMKRMNSDFVAVPSKDEGKKEAPNYGPTGRAHPITWLAEYLMRNSAAHGSSYLANHPYVLVEQAKK